MESVFQFENYKDYVQDRVREMPHGGKGQFTKIAKELGIHTSLLSHVFSGDRHLNQDQAFSVAKYFGLDPMETEYFLCLVQAERAETEGLRALTRKQLARLKTTAGELTEKRTAAQALTEQDKATFYSNWFYSGIRLLTSIPKFRSQDAIASYFALPQDLVRQVLDFLLSTGLCVEEKGRIRMGTKSTWVGADSPLVTRHHLNWRIKAMERMARKGPQEIFWTIPMSIGTKDGPKIRKILQEAHAEILKVLDSDSPPEKLSCLNIDWFDF